MPKIRRTYDTKLTVPGILTLHSRIGKSRTLVILAVSEKLAVHVLLETTVTDRYVKPVHPVERKIVPYRSRLLPIIMIPKDRSAVEKEEDLYICHSNIEDLALLVSPTQSKPRRIMVARKVAFKVTCETPVLVST